MILTAGGTPTKLEVPGELEYAGRGVSYCAVCDGAFFKGETIAVVGGGDAAVEEADYLTRYAEKVYVIHRRDEFRASKILQERLFANPKIEVIWNKRVLELKGGPGRPAVARAGGHGDRRAHRRSAASGCFVFIGFRPNTGLVKEHFAHDASGYIDHRRPHDDLDSRAVRGGRPPGRSSPARSRPPSATRRRPPSRSRST